MKAPEAEFRPKAIRRTPGVKVPVAAPSCALDLTRAPSWRREKRPSAAGNWRARGCSAAASSSIAAGGPLVAAVLVVDAAAGLVVDAAAEADDLELEPWLVEEPQPARASAITDTRGAPARTIPMALIMPSRSGDGLR